MISLDALFKSVLLESRWPTPTLDSHDYNFLPAAYRAARKAERLYGAKCINPLIEIIGDTEIDGPAIRVLISSLLKLVTTRQKRYELLLDKILPDWRNILQGNPQNPLPDEFEEASRLVLSEVINYPPRLVESLLKASRSQYVDVAIAALKGLQLVGASESIPFLKSMAEEPESLIRNYTELTLARLSALDKSGDLDIWLHKLISDDHRPIVEKVAALEPKSVGTGSTELSLYSVFSDSQNALRLEPKVLEIILDTTSQKFNGLLNDAIEERGLDSMPDTTLRRIVRSRFLPENLRADAYQRVVVAMKSHESILESTSRFGLIAHRNSSATAAWIGHCGIFISEDRMIHCTTGSDPHAVHEISYSDWLDGQQCWGIREDANHAVDLVAAVNVAREIASWRTEYDGTHNNQKGKWFKPWSCAPRYCEFDCVGFTEHVYELAGGDPTPNEFETGAGWPLTPREQRDHMRKVFDC